LDATVEAVQETAKATGAMNRQNDIAEAAQRAWIAIEPKIVNADSSTSSYNIEWRVDFRNIGKTVAKDVDYRAEFRPYTYGISSAEMAQELEMTKLAKPVKASSIIPGDSDWLGGTNKSTFDKLPWDDKGRCYLIILARAEYRIDGSDELHTTARAFAVGFKDKALVDHRTVQRPADVYAGFFMSRLEAYRIGPAIST